MKWILDTNVISETIRRSPNESVTLWIEQHPNEEMAISVLTLAEIQSGIRSAPRETEIKLRPWFDTVVLPRFGERALPLTTEVLIDWIRLSQTLAAERMIRRAADLLIASTARVHDLIIVTRNIRHFANTGVVVYDPWNAKTYAMDAP